MKSSYKKEIIISLFNLKKDHLEEIPKDIVSECMNYLNGKFVSAEVMSLINTLKLKDPKLSKTEIVEHILDHQERIMRSLENKL